MIDFNNASLVKLGNASLDEAGQLLAGILLPAEPVHMAYRGMRDWVVFTDRRVIAVNVQGLTGKKRDFSSLPYARIQAFSIETAGHFDLDSELELWFSGLGKVRLEFNNGVNIRAIGQLISEKVL